MSDSTDLILLERLLVPVPPILHDVLVFQMRDDESEGYPTVTQNLGKQMVISLHRSGEPPGLDAKEEEINAISIAQGRNELLGLFYGANKRVDIHL